MTDSAMDALPYQMSPEHRRVFIGLMIGMLVSSISQTIVGPGMPRIVADLGGMDHYSWVATSAMLVSAVSVPIIGKFSDLYGRRGFYLGGLAVFMLGALVCGLAVNFWMLVAGRAIQGLGMGTLMPLSQTIIGDIIPARQRGKYQGFMGAVFGFTSVAGPLAGGFITDALGWRWLFFTVLPLGLIALIVIARFLHLPHQRREAKIDTWGIVTLVPSLTVILLALSWAGTTYAWGSPQIIGLLTAGTLGMAAFVFAELRAAEPLLPMRLFRNATFTSANIAAFAVSMVMFGATIYIPVYAQGVLGVSATESGLILLPLMLGLIIFGILTGLLITRTGRYKEYMLLGVLIMAAGQLLLLRLDADSTRAQLTIAMAVFGVGLGMAMQQYTLVVQNASARRDLGIATASTQFFRNVGATVGIAVFGSIMTSGLVGAIAQHMTPKLILQVGEDMDKLNASVVLNPALAAQIPPEVLDAVRRGLSDQLHLVFLGSLPVLVVAFLATLAIRHIPLAESVGSAEDARKELLGSLGQSSGRDELVPGLGLHDTGARTRERLLAVQLGLLLRESRREERHLLREAVAGLADGDLAAGQAILRHTVDMLGSDDRSLVVAAERYAAALDRAAAKPGGILSDDIRKEIAVRVAADKERDEVLTTVEPAVTADYDAVDFRRLRNATNDLTTTLLLDLDRPPAGAASAAVQTE